MDQLYYEGQNLVVFTKDQRTNSLIRLYGNSKDHIEINCSTGEIKFSGNIEEPYKEMWLKFQQVFPEAFTPTTSTPKQTDPRKQYEDAMKVLK